MFSDRVFRVSHTYNLQIYFDFFLFYLYSFYIPLLFLSMLRVFKTFFNKDSSMLQPPLERTDGDVDMFGVNSLGQFHTGISSGSSVQSANTKHKSVAAA